MGRAWGIAAALVALAGVGTAQAANVVVLDAQGVALKAGQILDDRKVLDLNEGQRVTLITATGDTLKLRGPFHARPAPGATGGGGSLTIALASLLVRKDVRASDVGAVRAGSTVKLPDPWLVDVSHPGIRCVREGAPTIFWREEAGKASELAISPLNKGWRLTAAWAGGADRLSAPKELPVTGRATYLVDIGDGPVAITLLNIPASVDNDRMQAAWMFEKGCNLQAETLAQTFQ